MQQMFDASLPAYIENAFMDEFFAKVIDNMTVSPSSYNNVKNAVDLVKKVAENTPYGNLTIPFKTFDSIQHLAKINYQLVSGAGVYRKIIQKAHESYSWDE